MNCGLLGTGMNALGDAIQGMYLTSRIEFEIEISYINRKIKKYLEGLGGVIL